MCGIVGSFAKRNYQLDADFEYGCLVNLLSHRGPDDGAFWLEKDVFLGHRRLSIIDIDNGVQPMATEDGRFIIVFNGEIYNYPELRTELKRAGHSFKTQSDTEVLLKAYCEWKEGALSKLAGMFAFAIYDRRRNELFLARDRFGEKPLFVFKGEKCFSFSSEIRALCALPEFSREIDLNSLAEYLSLNYSPGQSTLFRNIFRVSPGSWMRIRESSEENGFYWNPPKEPCDKISDYQSTLAEFRDKFDVAVKRSLKSDVPVGVFLSGGIDSSLIAESAARQGKLNNAFCLDFEESTFSEFDKAKLVADRLGVSLHRVVLSAENISSFPDIVEHADDPFADSSCLPYWVLSKYAAEHNKVVLGGDGGDEIFGGYITYLASLFNESFIKKLPVFIRKGLVSVSRYMSTSETKVSLSYKMMRFLRAADLNSWEAHISWNGGWLFKDVQKMLKDQVEKKDVFRCFSDMPQRGWGRGMAYFQQIDLKGYLPNDILAKADRMSMAHGLEVRAPFLDYQLAEWALSLREKYKVKFPGQMKCLLRSAASQIYGNEIASAPKQGFSIPIHTWVRYWMKDLCEEYLSYQRLEETGVFNVDKIQQVLKLHFSGKRSYGYEIWGLLVFMCWHQKRIKNTVVLPDRKARRIHFDDFLERDRQ